MSSDRHPPTAVAAAVVAVTPTTCTLYVSWAVDTFWPHSETVEKWVVEVPGVGTRRLDPDELSCSVQDVPRAAAATDLVVRVCGWWARGPGDVEEALCAAAAEAVVIPGTAGANVEPIRQPETPVLAPLVPLPRTLDEPARIAASWSGDAPKFRYVYDSGREDIVDELTTATSLVFPAAEQVTYRFAVTGNRQDSRASTSQQWSPDWARATTSVPVQTSLRAFIGGRSGSGEIVALLRSRGIRATSLRAVMQG